jgi:outer membrane lipoprotein carrier protein
VKTCLAALVLTTAGFPEVGVVELLKAVEVRYNRAETMQVSFEQSLGGQGRITRTERGELSVRRPGRMRWDYSSPEGKLMLVDGKHVYYYNPATRKAAKSAANESDDLRVPLAFLMGRLDFQRDFKQFRSRREGDITHIVATPKSEKAPYTEVDFSVAPGSRILRVRVTGQDRSVMDVRFEGERLNPRLAPGVFQFSLPEGAELVESSAR